MSEEACKLTTKDFTMLEAMLERCSGTDEGMASILRRKLDGAVVMFADDIPEDVATLNSRISYRVDGGPPETGVLSREMANTPANHLLTIARPRGLALLGLSIGQAFRVPTAMLTDEWILLDDILHQPEAARRAQASAGMPVQAGARPALRLVHQADIPRSLPPADDDFDDPGPSAA